MKIERRSLGISIAIWAMRAITLAIALWSAFFVSFVNPINWKYYSALSSGDWVWLWVSNGLTVLLAVSLWWWCQRLLTRKIEKNSPNKRPDGTSAEAPPSNPSQGAAVPHP